MRLPKYTCYNLKNLKNLLKSVGKITEIKRKNKLMLFPVRVVQVHVVVEEADDVPSEDCVTVVVPADDVDVDVPVASDDALLLELDVADEH
jgi:hypothetical protein